MRIAIIGTGISGLGAAYLLHPHHEIVAYEQEHYLGGHSRTRTVRYADREVPVDTGFIVFNERTYPLLTGLFRHLGVKVKPSDMSFGASVNGGWLEYGTRTLGSLFGQPANALRPRFLRMLTDIARFNRRAPGFLDDPRRITLGEYLDELRMGEWFRTYYLLAMGAAIWSCPQRTMLDFPAESFLRFFHNHGLLSVNGQPQWYTVDGGSREYVSLLSAEFADRVHRCRGVKRVSRGEQGVTVTDVAGETATFDQVVFACHADQAFAMIEDADETERAVLGAFRYQKNRAVLHEDTQFMPRREACWSSWVYLLDQHDDARPVVSLTYWMNRLQSLETEHPLLVTLNPERPIEGMIHDEHVFAHPVFDRAALDAQSMIPQLQGRNRSWYCGAYQRYGFHEDGLWSAVRVAQGLGAPLRWT